jgi:hypothetical protein
MKDIFNFIGRAIFIIMFIEVIKTIWNGSVIGKLVLLSMLMFGLYHYMNQPINILNN